MGPLFTERQSEPVSGETVRRLVGVYDADGTWRGEVAYWIGARLGRTHCALCEITHGTFREKTAWKACSQGIPVPFDTLHRDEQPPGLESLTRGRVPCIAAETDRRALVLVDEGGLAACNGAPEALAAAIAAAVGAHGLAWPTPEPDPSR